MLKVNDVCNEQNKKLCSIEHIELENPVKFGASRMFELILSTYNETFALAQKPSVRQRFLIADGHDIYETKSGDFI